MRKREILTKVIMPVGMILLLAVIFRPFCMIQEKLDWRLLVLLMGIPFGVHKMCLWLVPSGMGISGTVGMVAFNLLIGGVIHFGKRICVRSFVAAGRTVGEKQKEWRRSMAKRYWNIFIMKG